MYLYENCKYIESREYISKSDKHVRAVSRGIRLVLRNINTIPPFPFPFPLFPPACTVALSDPLFF